MNYTANISIRKICRPHLLIFTCITIAFFSASSTNGQIITTIVGNGNPGSSGDNGQSTLAELNNPVGVAIDDSGNVYIADNFNNKVRKVNAKTGIITTIAGTNKGGYSGDNGPATAATLLRPLDIVISKQGDIYISDGNNQVIRKIEISTGIITTYAGNGASGYGGDNGPATAASFYYPGGMAFDSNQNLYIADELNYRVRKIDATTGIITTVVGNGNPGGASGDGGPATAAVINSPGDVKFDPKGNMYVTDGNNYIRKVDAFTGIITSIAGNGVEGFSGDSGQATAAEIDGPLGLALDASGNNVYFSDVDPGIIQVVDQSTGIINAVAGIGGYAGYSGDGGPATAAEIHFPGFMVIDHSGDLIFADQANNRIRKVAGVVGIETIADKTGILVYPNPVVNGSLYVTLENKLVSGAAISIYSITGQCVLNMAMPANNNMVKVDVHNIAAGMYLLKVQGKNGMNYVKKVVINNQ